MKINFKDILKLVVSIGLTAYVLKVTSKDVEWSKVGIALKDFEYGWILLSIGLSVISHALRAYRWTLLLGTRHHKPTIFTAYLALMVGYLTNMVIPRLGEVARCTILKKEERIPVSFSLGTVITDRLMDLLMLGVLALGLLLMQFDRLQSFIVEFIQEKVPILESIWPYLLLAGVLGITALVYVIRKARQATNQGSLLYKVGQFVLDLISGVKAIGKISNQGAFWFSTICIWILYFLMLYVISFGYGPTADLSFMAGLAVLVMGSLGMAAPVNNGIGAYQAFVASILVVYGITWEDGYVFALISHGSQVISVIVIGFLSLLILNFRKRNKVIDEEQQ